MKRKISLYSLIVKILLVIFLILVIFPFLMSFLVSLKTNVDFITHPMALPIPPHFENYLLAIKKGSILTSYMNSFIITFFALLGTMIIAMMASYVIARYNFRHSNFIFIYFILGMMIPIPILFIPLFKMFVSLGLYNTRIGIILIYIAKSIPFSILLLTGYFRDIPKELFESAEVDGATDWVRFKVIGIPLVIPGLSAVSIFIFRDVWNDFFMPFIFLRSKAFQTLPVSLSWFMGQFSSQWGMLYATLNMITIPLIIVYACFSKLFIKGLTSGALKG